MSGGDEQAGQRKSAPVMDAVQARIGGAMDRLPAGFRTELGRRVVTALLGAPLILLLITSGGRVGGAILAVILSLGMLWEYSHMVYDLPDAEEKSWFALGLAWLLSFANFFVPREEYVLLVIGFLLVSFYFLFTARRHQGPAYGAHFREGIATFFGQVYLVFLPMFLVLLEDVPKGGRWTVLFLLIVWASDIGGYFAGKRFGRRKLYPEISPKKTVEGAIGGLLAAVVVTAVYKLTFLNGLGWFGALAIPLLVATFAQIGDLCESFLKRAYDMKDSSSLLPGHGGFLDRFDGVLFGLPVMYACVRIFS